MQTEGLPEQVAPPPADIASLVETVVPLSVMLEAETQAPAPPPLMRTFAAIAAEDDSCVPELKQGIPPEFTVPLTVKGKAELTVPPLLTAVNACCDGTPILWVPTNVNGPDVVATIVPSTVPAGHVCPFGEANVYVDPAAKLIGVELPDKVMEKIAVGDAEFSRITN